MRHLFREIGVDVERDAFTVAGIGDMSGDVFGNGMLLSRTLRLVAAFDHRHIFLDPSPDPERTFAERQLLFQLPGSSWADFDTTCLSSGGGVFSRHVKRLDLTPQIRELLGTDAKSMSSEELVRAVLCLDVDLLYNGGIGTYVKASHEHHGEAHDERNDAMRVDACDLRCKIIGEGGNLGLTQAARVEFPRLGGRVHTDFIDNSGGVDLSDHEVNIKIALGELQRRGEMDFESRNELLFQLAPAVVDLVLETNRSQAQILSLEELESAARLTDHLTLLGELQAAEILDPELDHFPGAGELAARKEEGFGLVRPELATLLSFTKISSFESLVSSDLITSPSMERHFRAYFPEHVLDRCGETLRDHPLRSEITATVLTNEIVHRCGLTIISRLRRDLGSTVEHLARAYHVVDQLLRGGKFFALVERSLRDGTIPCPVAYNLIEIYRDTLADIVAWLVRYWPRDSEERAHSMQDVVDFLQPPFQSASQWIVETALPEVREKALRRRDDVRTLGVPEELAEIVGNFSVQREIPPVFFMAARLQPRPDDASAVYAMVRQTLQLDAALGALNDLPVKEPDDVGATRALKEQFRTLAVSLASRILEHAPTAGDLQEVVVQFFSADWSTFEDTLNLVDTMLTDQNASLGSFVILSERLRRLSDSQARE